MFQGSPCFSTFADWSIIPYAGQKSQNKDLLLPEGSVEIVWSLVPRLRSKEDMQAVEAETFWNGAQSLMYMHVFGERCAALIDVVSQPPDFTLEEAKA